VTGKSPGGLQVEFAAKILTISGGFSTEDSWGDHPTEGTVWWICFCSRMFKPIPMVDNGL